MAGDVFDTAAIRDHTLLLKQVIKVSGIKFGEAILLGDVDLKRKKKKSKAKHKINAPNVMVPHLLACYNPS